MEVRLIDPTAKLDNPFFDIVDDNNGTQYIDSLESYTQWSWNVTPLRSGESKLKVVVSVIKNGVRKESVYIGDVVIKINPRAQFIYWLEINWKYLLSTLIIPLVIFIYKKRKEKKKKKI